jgi:UDP-glucose 4-epimerase
MVEKVSGVKLRIEDGPRRAGDPAELVAASSKIRSALGWKPGHEELEVICSTAFRWEAKSQRLPPGQKRHASVS